MQALTLCRFDPVLGTVIFLKTPDSLFQEELDKIPSLMAIPSEGFFIHTFETFTTANLFIKLPSSNARGGIEKFLISIIIEGDSAVDLSVGKQFLVNFANDFINLEDAYKGLDIESKGYKGDIEKLNQIKNLFNSFFKTVKPVIDTLEISEHNLKERVKELTCLYGLSEILDDPYNSVEDVLLKTLNLIPPAWQYPENKCARIIYNNKEYKTGNFSDTPWAQTIVKEISGNTLTIQVNYLEDKPFLKEEDNLLNDIGNRLKMHLEEKNAEHNVKERVKELTCLYGLSEFLDDPYNSVEDVLLKPLNLIPPAWQYPENTCARIIYNNKEYKTGNFSDTPWAQTIVKEISGNILTIQVNYLEDKPFLKEEDNLLNDIGNRLKMHLEEKDAEENLRTSEETYRTLYKNIPGMVYRGKPDWSTEIINNSEIISGYSIEEFNSHEINWLEIIHSDDKNKVLNDSAKMVNNAMKLIQEYRIIAKDGSIHWVIDHKTSFFNKDGSLKGIDGVVYDITSRKKAEQNIKENLETTNLILEKLPVGVILIGKDKKIQSINEKALKIINYNEEDIIGKECFDLFCPAQKGNCPILDFGKSIDNSDEIILARNGDRIPILKTVIPITLQGEELLLEAFSDITSLKDVEESLKGALSDLDQIFDHTIPMYITDLDYNIIRVNKSFMNLFQVDSKHSLGKKCFEIWGGPLCNTPECSLKQILAGKEDYAYTMQKKLLNGEKISCIVRNFPYRNQENKILGVIKNFTNITDVIETERRMRVAQAKLKKNKDE